MPILTEEIFNLGLSRNGCLNGKQLFVLTGKRFREMSKGWKRTLYGTEISQEKIDQFLALKDWHIIKKELAQEEYARKKEELRRAVFLWQEDRKLKRQQKKEASKNSKARTEGVPEFIVVTEALSWKAQYRHPNWQRMRLYILNRDQFQCLQCGNTQKELHVHHTKYSGRFIWLTPTDKLITLCDTCHSKAHGKKNQ